MGWSQVKKRPPGRSRPTYPHLRPWLAPLQKAKPDSNMELLVDGTKTLAHVTRSGCTEPPKQPGALTEARGGGLGLADRVAERRAQLAPPSPASRGGLGGRRGSSLYPSLGAHLPPAATPKALLMPPTPGSPGFQAGPGQEPHYPANQSP